MELKTVEALEAVVGGGRPLGVMMKSIDELDEHCVRLLGCSPFAVLGLAERGGAAQALAIGGAAGFVRVADPTHLHVTLPEPVDVDERVGCSLLLLIPGLGETLRINGRPSVAGEQLTIAVEEAFVHCAKSILRSGLWDPPQEAPAPQLEAAGPLAEPSVLELLSRTPFLVVTSWDASGAADASPKGDPPGFLKVDAQGRLAVADRPGNRRTDTFHNLLEQPRVALLALIPGDARVVEVSGRASLTTDGALLASMAVLNKTPKLAMALDVERARVVTSRAVADARLWDASQHVPKDQLPRMADVFVEHVKLNKRKGLAAGAMRALMSKKLLSWALEQDYAKNRY